MYANIGGTVVHIGLVYLLTQYLDWEMTGIAIASSIHFIARFAITAGYTKFSGRFVEGYVPLFHEDSFKNWGE